MENEPKEDWGFVVTVTEAKPGCRAGHKVGDRFEFDYATPLGLCGEAFYAMYPLIHALRLGADLVTYSEATDPDTTTFTCPDQAWVTFEVRRVRRE